MAIREILLLGDPRLWEVSRPVATVPTTKEVGGGAAVPTRVPREVAEAVTDLADTLADFRLRQGFGRAIAAPQIGIPLRILFVEMRDGSFGPTPLLDPELVWTSPEWMELWDDCFSLPNLLVRVRRHRAIEVRYRDLAGETHQRTATGDLSELLQHEMDHLDGILATDRALDPRAFRWRSPATPV
jgi:peptide deformylase